MASQAADRDRLEEAKSRLEALLAYLEQDPGNRALRLDAAEAALDAGEPERTAVLLANRSRADFRAHNLAGLAALRLGRFEDAADAFSAIPADTMVPEIRFNLAWARANLKDHEGARALLDAGTTAALPQAAMLEVQLLHEAGLLDEAIERARAHLAAHPDHRGLSAAVSVLAIDVEDSELASSCAAKAGSHPDALTTLGTLALGEDNATGAEALFDRALAANERSPRAWVGRGLARLMTGRGGDAPADLDQGAELFGTHLGSWIAAGWAHFIAGDRATARARFEKALALDPSFAESHGALAVMDIAEGKLAEAATRTKVALRLDRECFGAALARSLLANAEGDSVRGAAILDQAMRTPIDGSGRTVAQSLARMGLA